MTQAITPVEVKVTLQYPGAGGVSDQELEEIRLAFEDYLEGEQQSYWGNPQWPVRFLGFQVTAKELEED